MDSELLKSRTYTMWKNDGQPDTGVAGRDGQKMSPVSQCYAVKKVIELSVFNLGR